MMWTEKEIKNLRNYAYQVFKTEIPLSGEIEKLQIFKILEKELRL